MVFARAALIACLALWPTAAVAQVSFPPGAEPRVDGIARLVDALEKAANARLGPDTIVLHDHYWTAAAKHSFCGIATASMSPSS